MAKEKKETKKFGGWLRFAINNYFILIFLACIGFVGLVSFYKLFVQKPTYVYTKVKIGQGLWWAATNRPSIWFVQAIKKGEEQLDLTGKPTAKILQVRYYPWSGVANQYEIYVTLKLKVSKLGKTGKYNFNRSTIGVGSPIDLEFPSTQFSGTVTEISAKPLVEKYVEKTIWLHKAYASGWEYEAIKIGDTYFNGSENIFRIVDARRGDSQEIQVAQKGGLTSPDVVDVRNSLSVKAKLKLKKDGGKYYFAEDQIIAPGKVFYFATDNFTFTDYYISSIE